MVGIIKVKYKCYCLCLSILFFILHSINTSFPTWHLDHVSWEVNRLLEDLLQLAPHISSVQNSI